jgi:hypothetical protein
MSAPTLYRVSMCVSIALGALSSLPAAAELPLHANVAVFYPKLSECCSEDGQLLTSPAFGLAVAIRNGIAFVGIPGALPTPRVAVYNQTATGWVRTATLTAPDAASANQFGRAIAFRDGFALIASHAAVHVFERRNGVWTAVQKLTQPATDPADIRKFPAGHGLRLENGILAVSGSASSLGNVVYIYELNADRRFVRRATLKASDASPTDWFGRDVGVAGNTVVVGAPGHNAAYVFKRRSDGRWVETQKLLTAEQAGGDFGEGVAIDRDMIIVGAPWFDCDGGVFCDDIAPPRENVAGGAAFVFVSVAGQYVETLKLRPRPDEHFDYLTFGYRIAMMGKFIVVAANESYGGISALPHGLAFTYTRDGSTVSAHGLASGYITANWMGLANNLLLLGSPNDDDRCIAGCIGYANMFDLNRYVE